MKKIILSLALLAGMSMTAGAQHLSNGTFDGTWEKCYPWEGDKKSTSAQGTQPAGWCIANVRGIGGLGATTVGAEGTGHNGSGKSVVLTNTPNPFRTSEIVPGYMTLGIAWATANASLFGVSDADGGTFGGILFQHHPDAIHLYFKRAHNVNNEKNVVNDKEKASIIAYLWKGEWEQANVPQETKMGAAPKYPMTDRDRNIMLNEKGTVGDDFSKTDDAELIASVEHYIEGNYSEWTELTIPFTYKTSSTPEKLNIIIGAEDYFAARSGIGNGNQITVDDITLLYYSELASATYDGTTVTFSGAEATVNAEYDATKLTLTSNGRGASVETAFNEETALLTIIVKGEDVNVNPSNTHTYTIQFNLPAPAESLNATYDGKAITFVDKAAEYSGVYHPELLSLEASNTEAKIQRFYDGETGLMTILVTDGDDVSTYTIKFEAPTSSTSYKEFLIVGINGETTAPQEATMFMYDMSDGSKTLVLKNFVLGGSLPVGNISLAGVTLNSDKSYASEQTIDISNGDASQDYWMGPMLGPVPVNMTGYAFDDKFLAHIDINMAALGQTIEVKFGYNYTRTVAADRWGTLCQPFSFTAEQVAATGFKFYSIEGVKWVYGEPQYISLKEEESIQGGMPYIFFSGENTALSLMGGTGYAESPSNKNGLCGVYARKDLDGGTYILSNNKICGGYANYVEANRAYIDIYDVPELDSNAKGVRFYFNDTATGIGSLNTEQTSAKAYDLAGRRMAATAKGIYIVNGKKIVLK